MRWSGRSASPARRWSDRAARRRARRGSKIPEDDRSFFFLYSLPHPEERPLAASRRISDTGVISWFETAQVRLLTMRDNRGSGDRRQGGAWRQPLLKTVALRLAAFSEQPSRICTTRGGSCFSR